MAVGIVETGVAFTHLDADANAPAASNLNFEDSLRHWGNDPSNGSFWSSGGRTAGFVKGTVGGDVLLTGAYDSNKINTQQFFSDVDPNQYFPITGDASLVTTRAARASCSCGWTRGRAMRCGATSRPWAPPTPPGWS